MYNTTCLLRPLNGPDPTKVAITVRYICSVSKQVDYKQIKQKLNGLVDKLNLL